MKFPAYYLLMLVLLVSTVSIEHAQSDTPLLTRLQETASSYFQGPFWQNTYGIGSNICQIGTMCASGLAWLGQKGLAGTNYTTALIKDNPKIAGTIALYTAWYIGQKRWAEDTITKAKQFLHAKIDPLMSFAKWKTNKYPTITSIISNKEDAAQELLSDYNSFNVNSFCECLKNRGTEIDQKAKALKLALEMEYTAAKQILHLFTENRTIRLTNVPYWIEQWIQNNYRINGNIDIFDLYNILAISNTKRIDQNLQNINDEIRAAEEHIKIGQNIKDWQEALNSREIAKKDLIKNQATQYEGDLKQFITQKIASTGLPSPKYVSEQPTAYWSWMRSAPWSIPSGFIWPYEREASQVYWELFTYTQRIAALHSAISEYIKQNPLQNGGPSYSLNQSAHIINAVNQFLGNSQECNAQYCIKKLQAQQ